MWKIDLTPSVQYLSAEIDQWIEIIERQHGGSV